MGASIGRLGGAVLAGALVVGLTSGTASAAPSRDDLRRAMAELADSGAAGVQVRVHDALGDWTGAAGVRELRGGKVPTNGAAGELISTTRDLDTFITALLDGDLLPADLLAEMRDALPISELDGYGLGLETLDAGQECGGVYEGHTGGIHGYQSFMFSTADGGKRFEISMTIGDVDVADPAAAERLGGALNNVLIAVVCGTAAPADRPMLVEALATA